MQTILQNKKGFTLIEIVIYVAILGSLAAALSSLTLSTLKNYRSVKIKETLASSADAVFGTFLRETKNADTVYLPTTVFDSDSGELSLRTPFRPTDKTESLTYVDIYLSSSRVWVKREGQTPQALTDNDLEVTRFKLTEVKPDGFGGVRMYLDIRSKDFPDTTISLTTFAMTKGNHVE